MIIRRLWSQIQFTHQDSLLYSSYSTLHVAHTLAPRWWNEDALSVPTSAFFIIVSTIIFPFNLLQLLAAALRLKLIPQRYYNPQKLLTVS